MKERPSEFMPNPARAVLLGPLLKGVSRSFNITLRVLPAGMRDPIGLAYLLARVSRVRVLGTHFPCEQGTEQISRPRRSIHSHSYSTNRMEDVLAICDDNRALRDIPNDSSRRKQVLEVYKNSSECPDKKAKTCGNSQ